MKHFRNSEKIYIFFVPFLRIFCLCKFRNILRFFILSFLKKIFLILSDFIRFFFHHRNYKINNLENLCFKIEIHEEF